MRLFSLLLLEVFFFLPSQSDDFTTLSCPCIHFNTSGTFHTPDYPRTFAPTSCLLFHFIAPPGKRVQLTMDSISLPVSLKCDSFLHVYDDLHTANLSEKTRPTMQICNRGGSLSDSSSYDLISSPTTEPSNGFKGHYKFFRNDKYKMSGQRVADCAYRIDANNGSIFSPRFPYALPANLDCSYHFLSRKGDRLSLSSKIFQLPAGCVLKTTDGKVRNKIIANCEDKHVEEWPAQRSFHLTTTDEITVSVRCGKKIDRPALYQIDFSYAREEETKGFSPKKKGKKGGGDREEGPTDACSIDISSATHKKGVVKSSDLVQRSGSLPQKCFVTLKGSGLSEVYSLQSALYLSNFEHIV
ncbi:hypothetical protein PFISCL1PPCAC_10999, partial [Pristionchus fissidentatus]